MPASRMNEKLIAGLKRKIKLLEKKEAQHRKKLKQAVNNATKAAKSYKSKLDKTVRDLKGKHTMEKAAACAKAAMDVERKMMKDAGQLCKDLKTAVVRMDEKHLKRIVKRVAKKAKSSTVSITAKRKPAKKRKVAKVRRKISTARRGVKK